MGKALSVIEILCIGWFVFELITRLIACPDKIKFIKKPYTIIDALSILPFFIWLILSKYNVSNTAKQILSTLRVMLLFKVSRHSEALGSFGKTITNSFKELMILLVYLSIGVVFFSCIVFYCEKDNNPAFR